MLPAAVHHFLVWAQEAALVLGIWTRRHAASAHTRVFDPVPKPLSTGQLALAMCAKAARGAWDEVPAVFKRTVSERTVAHKTLLGNAALHSSRATAGRAGGWQSRSQHGSRQVTR